MNDGLVPGTRVQVRNRFDGSWSSSPFEVAEALEPTPTQTSRYRVRRLSDGVVHVVCGVQGGRETLATAWVFRDEGQAFHEEPFEVE